MSILFERLPFPTFEDNCPHIFTFQLQFEFNAMCKVCTSVNRVNQQKSVIFKIDWFGRTMAQFHLVLRFSENLDFSEVMKVLGPKMAGDEAKLQESLREAFKVGCEFLAITYNSRLEI